jgi:hypothetical protein
MDTSRGKKEDATIQSAMIEGLARTQGVRPEEVRSLYETVLTRMQEEAVIADFVPIFAARKVKEMLLNHDSSESVDEGEKEGM